MFIAALFTIAKVRKHPKCPSMDERIKKMWYDLPFLASLSTLFEFTDSHSTFPFSRKVNVSFVEERYLSPMKTHTNHFIEGLSKG